MSNAKKAVTMLAQAMAYIKGLEDSPPSASKSIAMQGQVFTINQVTTTLGSMEQILQAPSAAKTVLSKAVAAANAQKPTYRAYLKALRQALILLYGSDTAGLAACGIVVTPKKPRTSETNAIAAARSRATRAANKKPESPSAQVVVVEPNGQVVGNTGNTAPASASAAPSAGAAAPAVAAGMTGGGAPATTH